MIIFYIHRIPGFLDVLKNNFDETLKINKINYTTKRNDSYSIIRYNKNLMTSELAPTLGLIKCLVLNEQQKAVGFAPIKALNFEDFARLNSENTSDIIAEEFIDGIMVNLFWNPSISISGEWEISTRNSVGGHIFCINKKTCATIFKEVISFVNLDIHGLNKSYSYSFVMKNADSLKPELYLVEIYEIMQTITEIILVFQMDREATVEKIDCFKCSDVKLPKQYKDWSAYDELQYNFASLKSSIITKGVVLKNQVNGERSTIYNPVYKFLTFCSDEKEFYKYLTLRHEGKIKEFLSFYPEEKKKWSIFREYLHDFTKVLHQLYIDCYVKKLKHVSEAKALFRSHMLRLHGIYVTELIRKKQHISYGIVKKYVNELSPHILFLLLIKPTCHDLAM